jgi:hypothetical protein
MGALTMGYNAGNALRPCGLVDENFAHAIAHKSEGPRRAGSLVHNCVEILSASEHASSRPHRAISILKIAVACMFDLGR